MMKKVFSKLLSLTVLMIVSTTAWAEKYECATFDAFCSAIENHNAAGDTIVLTENIYPTATVYTSTTTTFAGVLDGQGHTIKDWNLGCFLFSKFTGTMQDIVFDGLLYFPILPHHDTYSFVCDKAENAVFRNVTFNNCTIISLKPTGEFEFYEYPTRRTLIAGVARNCKFLNCKAEKFRTTGVKSYIYAGVGSFASDGYNCIFDHCDVVDCDIRGGGYGTGGIVGAMREVGSSEISNCTVSGKIIGRDEAGGIVGSNTAAYVHDCVNRAEVVCETSCVGGIGGLAFKNAVIENCTNYGTVRLLNDPVDGLFCNDQFGGIVGYLEGLIKKCINYGKVYKGDSKLGGIAGWVKNGTVIGCVNFGTVKADHNAGGIVGTMSKKSIVAYNFSKSDIKGYTKDICVGKIVGDSCIEKFNTWERDGEAFDTARVEGNCQISLAALHTGVLPYFINKKAGVDLLGQTLYPNGDYKSGYTDEYPLPNAPKVYEHKVKENCTGDNGSTYYNNYNNKHYGIISLRSDSVMICNHCSADITKETDTIQIYNATDLANFGAVAVKKPNIRGLLMADIDCDTLTAYVPIGTWGESYQGVFDGQFHRIKNLRVNKVQDDAGLFGTLSSGAVIKNLIMDASCSVETQAAGAGGIAGCVEPPYSAPGDSCKVSFINCGNEASVTAKSICAAGILGMTSNSDKVVVTFTNCYNTGDIKGSSKSAAICGSARRQFAMRNCWNSGKVTGYRQGYSFVNYATDYGKPVIKTMENNYSTLSDQHDDGLKVTSAAAVASGELCYLLNGSENGSIANGWYQLVDGEGTDEHPTFVPQDGAAVYSYTNRHCDETDVFPVYTNSATAPDVMHDFDVSGYCTRKAGETHYEKPSYDSMSDTYYLSNPGNLYWVAENVNNGKVLSNIELTQDIIVNAIIDENSRVWTPIGTAEHPFHGKSFDGNGHAIMGLYQPASAGAHYAGLFGVAYGSQSGSDKEDTSIKNVGVISSQLSTRNYEKGNQDDYAGAIVGLGSRNSYDLVSCNGPVISKCYASGVVSGDGHVGGIAGYVAWPDRDRFSQTYTTCTVKTNAYTGNGNMGPVIGFFDKYSMPTFPSCYYKAGCTTGTQIMGVEKSALAFQLGEVAQLLNTQRTTAEDSLMAWQQSVGYNEIPELGNEGIYHRCRVSDFGGKWGSIMMPFTLVSNDTVVNYYLPKTIQNGSLVVTKVATVAPNTPCFFKAAADSIVFQVNDLDHSAVAPENGQVTVAGSDVTTIGTYDAASLVFPASVNNYFVEKDQMSLVTASTTKLYAYCAFLCDTKNLGTGCQTLDITEETPSSIDTLNSQFSSLDAQPYSHDGKYLEKGRVVVKKNGKVYNLNGQQIKL